MPFFDTKTYPSCTHCGGNIYDGGDWCKSSACPRYYKLIHKRSQLLNQKALINQQLAYITSQLAPHQ